MFKKLLSVILSFTMMLPLTIGVSGEENQDSASITLPEKTDELKAEVSDVVLDEVIDDIQEGEADIPPEIAKMIELQTEALEAYSVLYTIFKVDNNGVITYPDDYAGTWIDGSKLIVAVSSDETKEKTDYAALLKDFGCVEYVNMKYSLNDLENIRANTSEKLSDSFQLSSHYVDEKNNKIAFEFLDFNEKKVNDALSVIIKDEARDELIDLNLFELKQGVPVINEINLYGGRGISNSTSSFSLGMCGTFKYDYITCSGFVTSAHGLSFNQTISRSGSSDMGIVRALSLGTNGDYALVEVTNGDTLTNKVYSTSSTTVSITGVLEDPPVGTTLAKYGFSGEDATADVVSRNITVTSSGISTGGITQCKLTSGSSLAGDSGGPYRSGSKFAGVHKGINTVSGVTYVYFTPYVKFKNIFTPKTS